MKNRQFPYVLLIATGIGLMTVRNATLAAENEATGVTYQTHVQNIGWQNWVEDGERAGTEGRSLRMEGIKIELPSTLKGNIKYQTHIQNIGWQEWMVNGQLAGTTGRSLRLEAMRILLEGEAKEKYDVLYRTHIQNIGWTDWVKNGAMSGTEGRSLRMEAVEIKLIPKDDNNPTEKPTTPPQEPEKPIVPTQKPQVILKKNMVFEYGQYVDNYDMVEKVIDKYGKEVDKYKADITFNSEINPISVGRSRFGLTYDGVYFYTTYTVKPEEKDLSGILLVKDMVINYGEYYDADTTFLGANDKNGNAINWKGSKMRITGDKFNTKSPGAYNVTYEILGTKTKETIQVRVTDKPKDSHYLDTLEGFGKNNAVELEWFGKLFEQRMNQWRVEHKSELKNPDGPVILPHDNECVELAKDWIKFDTEVLDWDPQHTPYGIGLTTHPDAFGKQMSDADVVEQCLQQFVDSPPHYQSMLLDIKSMGASAKIYKKISGTGYARRISYKVMLVVSFRKPDGSITANPPWDTYPY